MELWMYLVGLGLLALYVALLFTVCALTFKKGRMWLAIIGIFFPILWLIGAILPAKPGSPYDVEMHGS